MAAGFRSRKSRNKQRGEDIPLPELGANIHFLLYEKTYFRKQKQDGSFIRIVLFFMGSGAGGFSGSVDMLTEYILP